MSKKILVADDEEYLIKFIKRYLERRGVEVIATPKGTDVLPILEREEIDLVFLDIQFEDIGGLEILKEIKKKHPGVKVIIITGVKNTSLEPEARSLGADGFISKPVVSQEFNEAIQAFLPLDK